MDRRLINAEEVGLKRLRSFVRSKLRSHEAFIEVDYGAYSHTYCVTESAKLLVVLKNASIEIDKDSTSSNGPAALKNSISYVIKWQSL